MPYLIALTDPQAAQPHLAGGKAAGLARLLQNGFSVPDGFVVTTEAFGATTAGVLPPGLATELAAALDPACAYAVRSSATAEDLADASFAGQHDTILNCTGLPAVLDAVRQCFASLGGDRAVAYRRDRGIAPAGLAMAVVVQRMVAAEAAGVAFTLDPVGGALDEIHISAHPGLGESVVNGEAEVDRFVLAKADLTLRSAQGARAALCLSPAQAASVAGIARAVEAALGAPQDIEWAIDAAGVHLLQARPVTALPARWTRDESAERFPNPVTPLAWDFADAGFHAALRASFARMGLPPMQGQWFAWFDGYVYGNQTAVDLSLGRPIAGAESLQALRAALPELLRRFAWVDELPGEWPLTLDRFLLDAGRLGQAELAGRTPAEIWAHIQGINDTGRRYFRHNIAISIGQAVVHRALRGLLGHVAGPEATAAYDALLAAVETRTATLNRGLDGLAELARAEPALDAMLRTVPARRIVEAGGLAAFPDFQQAFDAFLHDHAHRELDADPYQPAWGDAPWTALDAVTARLDATPAPRDGAARRQKAASVLQRLCAGLPDDLAFLLQELVRLARLYTELDDLEHYQTARLGPLLRRAVQALGVSLADRLPLPDPLDLFFAREDALARAIAADGPATWQELGTAIAAAKRDYARQQATSPVWSLAEAPEPTVAEDALRGIPGSPGRATGPAYVVRSPEDFAACPAGAILVVRATTPAWTALFARAAGIVAESGGPLSHGAIAAREYGIPAVMAVRGAMQRLPSGRTLLVDGSRGTIECQ